MLNKNKYWLVKGMKIFFLNSKNEIRYRDNNNYNRLPSEADETVIYIPKKGVKNVKNIQRSN